MRRSLLLALLCLATPLAAQTPGECALGTAQADLATPDLFARLFNTGSLFYGNDTFSGDGYFVPRSRQPSSIYAAGLWVGGRIDGDLRVAAASFRDFNFWPGPLDAGAVLPNRLDCSAYDRIFVVSPQDVAAYEAGGSGSADLAAWPVGLGAPAVGAGGQPVAITSRGQTLNLAAGERPVLRGGPTAFWVMNDVGGPHTAIATQPLGIEVQVTAFVRASSPATLRQSSFYRYTVVNRGTQPIDSLHVGFFADTDLGNGFDDYVGSDSTRGMGYTYNGRPTDDQYGVPPALGVDILSGAYAATYFQNHGNAVGTPTAAPRVYNFLQGFWGDGTPMRALGDGYNQPPSASVTRWMFSGDPVAGQPWSEVNPGPGLPANTPSDRRFVTTSVPVTLAPGASHTVDVGLLFAQGNSRFESVTALRTLSDLAQGAYDAGALFGDAPLTGTAQAPLLVAPAEGARFTEAPVPFEWSPVAGAEASVLEVSTMPDFARADVTLSESASVTLPAARFLANRTAPFYWRVRTVAGGLEGPPSASRVVQVYRYVAGPLQLASGAPAFVETTAPGGGAACEPDDPDEGCAEVGGDLVFESLNSTGDYAIGITSDEDNFAGTAPNEIEIRFTTTGSIAFGVPSKRVPFEMWDIGPVTPGQPNDPADDRQLIPFARSTSASSDGCAFGYDAPTQLGIGPSTPIVTGHLPVSGSTYADFEAIVGPLILASPDGCLTSIGMPAFGLIDRSVAGTRIRNVFFEQAGARTFDELTGSTARFYTADRVVVSSEGGTEAPRASALGAAYPNPVRASLAVPYTLATSGVVKLRVVDALGRTVAVLADGPQAAGEHQARLDVRHLAAGVYALVLEAGDARSTRTVTVVR